MRPALEFRRAPHHQSTASAAIIVAVVACMSHSKSHGEEPLDIGQQKQLLVDDAIIAEMHGVVRELGAVTKSNGGEPIFTDGWFYGTVLHDEGRFKLWFRKPQEQGYRYAESTDGVHFTPLADVVGINFAGDYTLAVEIDPRAADGAHRYMAAYDAPGMAAGIAYSADGINWNPANNGRPVTGRAADTYNQMLWDPLAQTYRLLTRTDFGTAGGSEEVRGTRMMVNSDPLNHPTDWQVMREWMFDRDGDAESGRRQLYAATCWIYEGVYFSLLTVYEYPGDLSEGTSNDFETSHTRDVMDFYIATSRNGSNWDLSWVYADQPMIPRGEGGAAGSFDKDLILPASTIVTHDDRHWLYYAGANERHGTEQVRFDREHAIGLATLRLDGFVALATEADAPGIVVTRPFRLTGDNLLVNVDARDGRVQVEVLDESGQPISEFAGESAVAGVAIDELRWRPSWTEAANLASLEGRVIRLRFHLERARLYAFQVVRSGTQDEGQAEAAPLSDQD